MKDCGSGTGKKTGGKGTGKEGNGKGTVKGNMGKGPGGTKSTRSTAGHVENLVTMHEIAEATQLLVKVRLVKKSGRGTRLSGMNSNLNLKLEARLEVCVCVLSVDKRTH